MRLHEFAILDRLKRIDDDMQGDLEKRLNEEVLDHILHVHGVCT
jgi:hypothetical protein